ncbi:hypothetical protein [Aeromonas veronii]|uniref:hypothetical protein n=1 Tax=Aeromonas veronii TaxID=654 RepID=UPI0036702983
MAAVKNIWTTEGSGVWINLEGHGKTDAEITAQIPDVTHVSPLGTGREVKKKGTVSGAEYSAGGKQTYTDPEVKFLLNDKTMATYNQLLDAIDDATKLDMSLKVTYPWGETVYGDVVLVDMARPEATESHEIVEITAKFAISGRLKRIVKK